MSCASVKFTHTPFYSALFAPCVCHSVLGFYELYIHIHGLPCYIDVSVKLVSLGISVSTAVLVQAIIILRMSSFYFGASFMMCILVSVKVCILASTMCLKVGVCVVVETCLT